MLHLYVRLVGFVLQSWTELVVEIWDIMPTQVQNSVSSLVIEWFFDLRHGSPLSLAAFKTAHNPFSLPIAELVGHVWLVCQPGKLIIRLVSQIRIYDSSCGHFLHMLGFIWQNRTIPSRPVLKLRETYTCISIEVETYKYFLPFNFIAYSILLLALGTLTTFWTKLRFLFDVQMHA